MKIYLAGPMTGYNNYNRDAFWAAEERLRARGHLVWNPAMHPDGFEHEEYLKACLPAIEFCDIVYLLNGWTMSDGARAEVAHAIRHGKIIRTEAEDD